MKDELLKQLENLQELSRQLAGKINIEEKRIYLKELEFELIYPDLWLNNLLCNISLFNRYRLFNDFNLNVSSTQGQIACNL